MDKLKPVHIRLEDWDHTCGDGCCFTYGTVVYVDGVKSDLDGYDKYNAITAVLNQLGYEPIFE